MSVYDPADKIIKEMNRANLKAFNLIKLAKWDEINKLRLDKINCNLLLQTQKATLENCRNELCLKCGQYKLDCCGECRWKSGC